MEFHIWGTLDENGRIQSVQSSCSHGNSFNMVPNLSSQATLINDCTGEKFVPYSTKKDLVYKLDNKIDEMSLIMVQMGELTKRLKLQEKLISEYEEKAERQTAEMKKLRQENDQFRSMISKRRRNDSSYSVFEESPLTTPKVLEAPMDICDIDNTTVTDGSTSCSNSELNYHAIHNASYAVQDEQHAQVTDIEHEHGNGYVSPVPKCSVKMKDLKYVDKVSTEREGMPLAVDEYGYVPIPAIPCGTNGLQGTQTGDSCGQEFEGVASSSLSVKATDSEKRCVQDTSHETNISAVNPIEDIDNLSEKGKDTPPKFHKTRSSFYSEIPDASVSSVTSSATSPAQSKGKEQGHDNCQGQEVDRYRERPPMPIPSRRRVSESSVELEVPTSSDPGMPQINRLSKELKNNANDEARETSGLSKHHRHSSPNLSIDMKAEDKLKPLIQNMKTTMEWNEARKLLMAKCNTCTTEKAESVLYGVVKDTYHKCAVRLSGSTSKANLIKSLQKYLLKNRNYDADLLTTEFLGKCIHLMMNN